MLLLTKKQGFSLLEIVIAMAIVTIGVLGVMVIFPAGLRASQRAADFTTAATLGSHKLQYIMGQGYGKLTSLPTSGGFIYHSGWTWSRSFQPDPPVGLVEVTVSIHKGVDYEKRFVTFMAP